jgi:hypothetical protein
MTGHHGMGSALQRIRKNAELKGDENHKKRMLYDRLTGVGAVGGGFQFQ